MSGAIDERRASQRVAYPCDARCFALGTSLPNAHITDLSVVGAFIETHADLPERTVLLLRFRVGDCDVKVEGEVVRRKPGAGLAVRFLSLAPEHRAAIERAAGAVGT